MTQYSFIILIVLPQSFVPNKHLLIYILLLRYTQVIACSLFILHCLSSVVLYSFFPY